MLASDGRSVQLGRLENFALRIAPRPGSPKIKYQ